MGRKLAINDPKYGYIYPISGHSGRGPPVYGSVRQRPGWKTANMTRSGVNMPDLVDFGVSPTPPGESHVSVQRPVGTLF